MISKLEQPPSTSKDPIILRVEDLSVRYRTARAQILVLRDIELSLRAGETYGIVGESGSGKSTLGMVMMGYLPPQGEIISGSVLFQNKNLLDMPEVDQRKIWGTDITLVPQDPLTALNPSMRVGAQIEEILRHHFQLTRGEADVRIDDLLERVQVADRDRIKSSYPHQLSGGMQQRVMIAMAISTRPKLIVLDEPTTNLDTTTQAVVLELIQKLIQEEGASALYISHNLGVVAQISDRVAILYAGEVLEDGPTSTIFSNPSHPYTRALLDSVPRIGEHKHEITLQPMVGRFPSLEKEPRGCVFKPRCRFAIEVCAEPVPMSESSDGHIVRCHRIDEIISGELVLERDFPASSSSPSTKREGSGLRVENLSVKYALPRSFWEVVRGEDPGYIQGLNRVSLALGPNHTLGLVGESGSGKSTFLNAIIGLVDRTEGHVFFDGDDVPGNVSSLSKKQRRQIRIVFQNPHESLNPHLTIGETLRRPFKTLLGLSQVEAEEASESLLELVHLPKEFIHRYPDQLSGGEKQRVAIARAYATQPDLFLADEAVSSLDVSVQASILALLSDLQVNEGTSMVFVSHDLAVVGYIADTIAVIYLGGIVEISPSDVLFEPPYHPYTEALLSAVPSIDPTAKPVQVRLEGEPAGGMEIPSGCAFHPRCPRYIGQICELEVPPERSLDSGKRYRCHIPPDELKAVQRGLFRTAQQKES
ncbi:MAG: dipeptide ABC transporter ATP-binding protein [Anaerolineales bacterium]